MSTANRKPDFIAPISCESTTVAEGAALVVGSADNTCALPAGADPNPTSVNIIGLALTSLSAAGTLDVVTSGIWPGVAAASITRGQPLTIANVAGGLKPAAPGAGSNVACVGIALESASSGERFSVLVRPFALQG